MTNKERLITEIEKVINQWSKNKRYKRKMEEMRLKEIRKNERKSHIEIYSNAELYKEGSWLIRPIKTVVDLIPLFDKYEEINVLDLGCGVGRNCICIARNYYDRLCKIDCVDILDLAIEKLNRYYHGHIIVFYYK